MTKNRFGLNSLYSTNMNGKLRTLVISLSLVLIAGFVFVTFFLEGILRNQLINKLENTFHQFYQIDFKSSQSALSGFNLSTQLKQVTFTTDTTQLQAMEIYPAIFFEAKEFEIVGIHMFDLLFNNELIIENIELKEPDLLILIPESGKMALPVSKKAPEEKKNPLTAALFNQLEISGGQAAAVWYEHPTDTLYAGRDLSLTISRLGLPLNYSEQIMKAMVVDNIEMDLSEGLFIPRLSPYRFAIKGSYLNLKDSIFTNYGIKAIPKSNLYQTSLGEDYRKTFFNISADTMHIKSADLNALIKNNLIVASELELIHPSITLFQNMNLPRDEQVDKPVLGQVLHDIPMELDVDTIKIRDLDLHYEILAKGQTQPAVIDFTNLHGHFANLRKSSDAMDTVLLELEGQFMEEGNIYFEAKFPLSDPKNQFYSGHIAAMPFASFNPIFSHLGKINFQEGVIHNIYFTGTCSEFTNKGDMIFDYENLKVEFRTKRDRKAWLKSGLTNLLVRNNSKTNDQGKATTVSYQYERPPFIGELGFIVHGITDGVAQVVLPRVAYRIFSKK